MALEEVLVRLDDHGQEIVTLPEVPTPAGEPRLARIGIKPAGGSPHREVVGCAVRGQGIGIEFSQPSRGAEVADGPRTEPDESLEVSAATPEVLHDVVPPVETRLGVTLDDGVRVTLDSNLSDMCQASSDGRELVCTVDAALGDFITETVSGTSIDLELEGLGGQIIKAELRDGNLHIDAEHGHLLSSVGALVVGEDGS